MELRDRVVIITGSSSGIGFETSIAFAKESAKVVVTYNSTKSGGEKALEYCKKYSEAMLTRLDTTKEASVRKALDEILKRYGKIDILINNAGVATYTYFEKQTWEEIQRQVDVNLLGTMRMTHGTLPLLKKRKEAIIVNVASMCAKEPHATLVPYCATKYGVRGFTQALAEELPKRIRTYAVNPGLTATRLTHYQGTPPERVAKIMIRAAKETLRKKSGHDIDVPQYL